MSPVRICGLLFPLRIQWYRPCWLSDILCLQRPSDLCNLYCPLRRLRCAQYWAFQGQISHVTQERKHISVEAGKLICCALAITLEPEPANQHTDVKDAGFFFFFFFRHKYLKQNVRMICSDVYNVIFSQCFLRFWCHDTASSTLSTVFWCSSATWVTMSRTCLSTPPSQSLSSNTAEGAPSPSLQTRPTLRLLPAVAPTPTLLQALGHPAPSSSQVHTTPVKILIALSGYVCQLCFLFSLLNGWDTEW